MNISEIDELNFNAWEQRRVDLRQSYDLVIKVREAAQVIDYQKGIADSSRTLGYCYWRFSDYSLSLSNSLQALKFYRSIKDKKNEAETLNSIGTVYMFQKEHQKRLDCNLRCLKIREEVNDHDGIAGSQNNIGETYFEMGDMENALKWFNDCLSNKGLNQQSKAWATHNLGRVYYTHKDFQKANDYFNQSLNLSTAVGYQTLSVANNLQIAAVFFDLKDYEKALSYANTALMIAEKIGSKEEIKSALFLISEIKEKMGLLDEALSYFKKYHTTHSEIFNESNLQRIRDIEFQFEIERITKEAEIERLKTVELRAANEEIEQQKHLLEHRNNEILDSIRYAKRIQQALLKDENHISKHLPPHFVLFKPKDIVSGDFYLVLEKDDCLYIAVADCTGHGVPGAFLTMLGTSYINEIAAKFSLPMPAQILDELRLKLVKELGADGETKDGMDISIAMLSLKTNEHFWAGANNPLWIIRKESGLLDEIKPDKQPIGYTHTAAVPFTNHKIQLNKGDLIYLLTDGFADQFGGPKGKKFKYKQLKETLLGSSHLSLIEQKENLETTFEDWKQNLEQVDDICIVGICID